ncbi:MAG: flagellar protein FlaG [Steroidobacteraceae bacterium]
MVEENDSLGPIGAIGSAEHATAYESAPSAPSVTSARGGRAAGPQNPPKQPSTQEVQAAIKQINEHLASVNRVLDFRVDAATGLTIATIRNAQTGAILQQIPGTDMMHLAQMLADWSPGRNVLVDLIA